MSKINWIPYFEPIQSKKLIDSAIETANWIKEYEHTSETGKYWDVLPGSETKVEGLLLDEKGLYAGATGIALFFLRLYLSTEDEKWLEDAKAGVDYVISQYRGKVDFTEQEGNPLASYDVGYLNGPPGGAYVAELLYQVTKEEKYRNHFIRVTEDLIESANPADEGITWYGAYGIIAEGTLPLYLLFAYETLKEERYLEAAKQAGRYIASKAEEAPSGGYRWYAMDTETFPTLDGKGYFPGFFYGAAGSSYILASIYEYTKEEEFLKLAQGGAEYILSIADVSEDGEAALVRYNDPLGKDLYYLGMCQGPIGTSRLFYKLYKITGEQKYLDFVVKLTEGILAAGAPAKHSPGYWHTYCYCCGAAGMLEHFVSIYKITGKERYLNAAKEAAEVLIGDAYVNRNLRRWYTSWNRHEPDTSDAYIGLYHGSAGCAASLLVLNSVLEDKKRLPGFLEDPYKY